jgi:AbrB family looped-hinge helix DNA binding protein
MNTTVTLDRAGRIVIPKPLRDELSLGPGDSLLLDSEGSIVTLRPAVAASRLAKKRGVWVLRGRGTKLTTAITNKTLRDQREERDRKNLHPSQ